MKKFQHLRVPVAAGLHSATKFEIPDFAFCKVGNLRLDLPAAGDGTMRYVLPIGRRRQVKPPGVAVL